MPAAGAGANLPAAGAGANAPDMPLAIPPRMLCHDGFGSASGAGAVIKNKKVSKI